MKQASILSTILLLTISGIHAEEAKPASDPPKKEGRGSWSSEDRLKRLNERLSLTQEQQDKVKAIFARDADAFKAILSKGRDAMTDEDRTKLRDLLKAQTTEIETLLTEEQKPKYKEMIERRRGGGKKGEEKKPEGSK